MANGMPSMNSAGMGELFARLRFVLIALLIYRIGTHIPVPGIDPEQLASLFDQNHRIIGQLYGGLAACSGSVNNGQYDYYGRIGVSWSNGLDTYLNPSACGGTVQIENGYDPNTPTLPDDAGITGINSPLGPYCIDNFDPEITLRLSLLNI